MFSSWMSNVCEGKGFSHDNLSKLPFQLKPAKVKLLNISIQKYVQCQKAKIVWIFRNLAL